jgi:hypothetical protein
MRKKNVMGFFLGFPFFRLFLKDLPLPLLSTIYSLFRHLSNSPFADTGGKRGGHNAAQSPRLFYAGNGHAWESLCVHPGGQLTTHKRLSNNRCRACH